LDNINYNNNNDNLNLSYELDNKYFLNEMEKDLYRTYNQQFENNINKEKETIDYYQKLIEEENKKEGKINEKMNYYEAEIANLKNEINEIKSKNNEELSLFKQYINNLSSNDEEIKNKLISNKKKYVRSKRKSYKIQ